MARRRNTKNRRNRRAMGGRACGGPGQRPCNGGGYRRGGRVKNRRRMQTGGHTHQQENHKHRMPWISGTHNTGNAPLNFDHWHYISPQNTWGGWLETSGSMADITGTGPHNHPSSLPRPTNSRQRNARPINEDMPDSYCWAYPELCLPLSADLPHQRGGRPTRRMQNGGRRGGGTMPGQSFIGAGGRPGGGGMPGQSFGTGTNRPGGGTMPGKSLNRERACGHDAYGRPKTC